MLELAKCLVKLDATTCSSTIGGQISPFGPETSFSLVKRNIYHPSRVFINTSILLIEIWDSLHNKTIFLPEFRFARVSSHVADFNARNKSLTAKLLLQGYRYHKLRKTFSKFYRRHYELVSKFNVGLKTLLHQGLLEPEFYGDLMF